MTRLAAFACSTLLLTAQGSSAQQSSSRPPLNVSDATIGELRAGQVGSIILPQGPPPFAAVVVLHGCNGVSQNTRAWARRLASWGYAALILDSFSPRGIDNVCSRGMQFPGAERAKDAFAAAAYLRTRKDIDPDRIGLLGYSHGGWTALAAARERAAAESGTKPFAAIVAYYPNCPPGEPALASDVLILAAGADDWAPPQRCTDLMARYANASTHKPLLKIYPGASHSFDAQRPERVYLGHKLAYDETAARDSFTLAKQFLDDHLKR